MASQLSGEMSMALTSTPRSCRASAWHPAPAPMSSTRPRAVSRAFCSRRGIWSKERKRWATGISSSSNIDDITRSDEALPVRWQSRMAAPMGSRLISKIAFFFIISVLFVFVTAAKLGLTVDIYKRKDPFLFLFCSFSLKLLHSQQTQSPKHIQLSNYFFA